MAIIHSKKVKGPFLVVILCAFFFVVSGCTDGTVTWDTGDGEAGETGGSGTGTGTGSDPLGILPSSFSVGVSATQVLSGTGGTTPYTYSITSGTGSLSATSGSNVTYTAPATTGSAAVTVTDASADTAVSSVTINNSLSLQPSSITVVVSKTKTLTAAGGSPTYSYAITAGTGSLSAATGASTLYTAPVTSGTATVTITASDSETAVTSVTINPVLALTPVTTSVAVSGTRVLSSTGGVGVYTYAITSGTGSLSASTGRTVTYTAPTTSGSATVRVTDSDTDASGDADPTSDTSVITINPALNLTPSSTTVAVTKTRTFTATGGVGTYNYSVIGTGTISATTGASTVYTAPGGSGTATVRVTDDDGSKDSSVTISVALDLTPASTTLAVGNTKTFTPTGGTPPYNYSISSGTGSLSALTGSNVIYTAIDAGNAKVLVTDDDSSTDESTISIKPALSLTPSTFTVVANKTQVLTPTGGVLGYTYSISAGTGTLSATTGASVTYTAPASSGTATIKVDDSNGNSDTSAATINAVLSISPSSPSVSANAEQVFTSTGGLGLHTYVITTGGGSLSVTTGITTTYTAPGAAGSATVTVSDTDSNSAPATITITAAHPSGVLDTTFDTDGIYSKSIFSDEHELSRVIFDTDGKVVAAGYSDVSGTRTAVVMVRFETDGSIDTSFETDGKVMMSLGGNMGSLILFGLTKDRSGKIMVAIRISGMETFGLYRVLANGQFDTTYDSDGRMIHSLASNEGNYVDLARIPNTDDLMAVGTDLTMTPVLQRLNSNGGIDTVFNQGTGELSLALGSDTATEVFGEAITFDGSGRILISSGGKAVSGGSTVQMVVYRLDTEGEMDNAFAGDGVAITNITFDGDTVVSYGIEVDSEGRVVAMGYSDDGLLVARFHSEGVLDSTFDTDGTTLLEPGTGTSYGNGIVLDSTDRIVVVSTLDQGTPSLAAQLHRIKTDGALDTTFDTDGKKSVAGIEYNGFGVGIEPLGGKIVVVGSGKVPSLTSGHPSFLLFRVHP